LVENFDTIVLGLGAVGSAAAYQLAKRGNKVLGIDRFTPPHAHGSTHGDTRITRLAIGEGAQYTPLAIRSHEIWREVERETGATLLTTNGGLIISSRAPRAVTHVENFFENTLAAAKKFAIDHEVLDAAEIRHRFPQFNVRDDEVGYFERDAGFLRPEECVRAQLSLARRHGAAIHVGETVRGFDATPSGVEVATDRAAYSASRLIIAAGPWLSRWLSADRTSHFKIYRQTMLWFDIRGPIDMFASDRFPVFIWELQGKAHGVYGFPAIDGPAGGLKVATEHFGGTTTPDAVDRGVTDEEKRSTYENCVAPYLPAVSGTCLRATTCLYTVTPDFGFVIDAHPEFERVVVASPCSGHGFKHSAAIGEALAELIVDGASRLDLGPFRWSRFDPGGGTGG
jgi:sarcosine oxidase